MVEDKADMTMPRVAWVDLDDTLWDFHANSRTALGGLYDAYDLKRYFDSCEAWIECYEHHNHELWSQYNRALIEKPYLMRERFVRPLTEGGCPDTEELWPIFDKEYLDRMAECTLLIDGAIELLEELHRRGWKTGILSNGFVEVQHRKIRNSGLTPHIDYIVLSDDIGVNKPDERIYRHAERVAGTTAERCLMIGDNIDTDIAGALNAGWDAVFFNRYGKDLTQSTVPTAHTLAGVIDLI